MNSSSLPLGGYLAVIRSYSVHVPRRMLCWNVSAAPPRTLRICLHTHTPPPLNATAPHQAHLGIRPTGNEYVLLVRDPEAGPHGPKSPHIP